MKNSELELKTVASHPSNDVITSESVEYDVPCVTVQKSLNGPDPDESSVNSVGILNVSPEQDLSASSDDFAPFIVANLKGGSTKSKIFQREFLICKGFNTNKLTQLKEKVRYLSPLEYVEHELGKPRKASTPHNSKRTNKSRWIRWDCSRFCSCTFYNHIFIIAFEVAFFFFYLFTNTCPEKDPNGQFKRCWAADFSSTNGFAAIFSLILIDILYLIRLIEKLNQKNWLQFELHLYTTLGVLHLLSAFGLFIHGSPFWAWGGLSLILFFQFIMLAVARVWMIRFEMPAQQNLFDPDGNQARARDPNSQFVHGSRLITMWTS